jgi:hypothetical protein
MVYNNKMKNETQLIMHIFFKIISSKLRIIMSNYQINLINYQKTMKMDVNFKIFQLEKWKIIK